MKQMIECSCKTSRLLGNDFADLLFSFSLLFFVLFFVEHLPGGFPAGLDVFIALITRLNPEHLKP